MSVSCRTFYLGLIYLIFFITVRNRGGGHKRLYRKIDFKRNKLGISAKVCNIEYDPNRTSRIALITFLDGEKRYILHCIGLKINDFLISDFTAPITIANTLPLFNIPIGTLVHNIEFQVRIVRMIFSLQIYFIAYLIIIYFSSFTFYP